MQPCGARGYHACQECTFRAAALISLTALGEAWAKYGADVAANGDMALNRAFSDEIPDEMMRFHQELIMLHCSMSAFLKAPQRFSLLADTSFGDGKRDVGTASSNL